MSWYCSASFEFRLTFIWTLWALLMMSTTPFMPPWTETWSGHACNRECVCRNRVTEPILRVLPSRMDLDSRVDLNPVNYFLSGRTGWKVGTASTDLLWKNIRQSWPRMYVRSWTTNDINIYAPRPKLLKILSHILFIYTPKTSFGHQWSLRW